MLNISKEDMDFLLKNLPDGERIVKEANEKNDVNIILNRLDDVIARKGLDDDYWYNDFGNEAQCVYDRLYEYA